MGICGISKKSPKVNVSNNLTNNQTLNHRQRPPGQSMEEKKVITDFKDFEEYNSKIFYFNTVI